MQHNEDDAWRAIVDNYGDRPELGHEPEPEPEAVEPEVLEPDAVIEPPTTVERDDAEDPFLEDFVPPDPALPPLPPPDRTLAWLGVLGSPAVLLLAALVRYQPPGVVSLGLVTAFVAGFCYLVLRAPREPRDPYDDGAQV